MGGVKLNLKDPQAACDAINALHSKFSKQDVEYHGIMISEMVPKGLEMMIGANRDATFGPITVSGLGGIMVEVLKDVVFNMCPAPQEEVMLSLKGLKNERLIAGYEIIIIIITVTTTKFSPLLFSLMYSIQHNHH